MAHAAVITAHRAAASRSPPRVECAISPASPRGFVAELADVTSRRAESLTPVGPALTSATVSDTATDSLVAYLVRVATGGAATATAVVTAPARSAARYALRVADRWRIGIVATVQRVIDLPIAIWTVLVPVGVAARVAVVVLVEVVVGIGICICICICINVRITVGAGLDLVLVGIADDEAIEAIALARRQNQRASREANCREGTDDEPESHDVEPIIAGSELWEPWARAVARGFGLLVTVAVAEASGGASASPLSTGPRDDPMIESGTPIAPGVNCSHFPRL